MRRKEVPEELVELLCDFVVDVEDIPEILQVIIDSIEMDAEMGVDWEAARDMLEQVAIRIRAIHYDLN